MRSLWYIVLLFFIISCGSSETATYQSSAIAVSGEFLFEGANTLQGPSTISIEDIANELGIPAADIKSVHLKAGSLVFSPDSLSTAVESVLVQWVSNDLPMVAVATKNPIPEGASVSLDVTGEQDIAAYLSDPTATLVVDTNIAQDLDNLEASVSFEFEIKY